ncbi:proline-rich receptor-like protein kinase PERK10 isoform X2 [Penaeus chinensis]|uniref:proline-rich receptor-like protein kinase PERK10 isoform X2 n=1 Tax=Penaeus chinensis TaxID=139456 RepID=UPI001FB6BC1D|nr:proline-rich receptor-like protein kinase PERK10 isoform X2 [Penaeus chinensis]
MATNIDELVKEAEETDFVLDTQDELLTLIETLRDFEKEAEKRLKDIKTTHCDKNETKEAKNEEGDEEESREAGLNGGDSAAELTLEQVRRELMSLESEGHEDGNKQSTKDTGVSIESNDKSNRQRPNVKFDMDAFNDELANLLAISGKAVEPQQAWRAIRRDAPKDVPTTPPSTPSHTDRPLPGQTQEPAPPSSQPMAPPSQAPPRSKLPPPKPPRTFLATSDYLKTQPMPLSKSTSDLEQPGTSSSPHTPRGEDLTASPMAGEDSDSDHRTKTNGKKENIFFPSLMGKKVKEKITTIGRKKPKRSKSLISDPMDFRILYNGMLPNHRDNDRDQQISATDPNDSPEEDPREDKIKA